ncbi:Alpha-amylase [Methanococcus aeolicus Nankai-3]|uniref:Alpha-amylase n=1 Tax=Methanococcus aeolicus (strain ATCC BAA-1280 / DSM 17508 / OCM 812 / Nankai-3) TaxID=419665 RepID=A6USY2_META3|nr:Alpha-amylase [Methanococcus aeolicus Nankai-3]
MLISFNFEVHQPHRLNKYIKNGINIDKIKNTNNNNHNLWDRYIDVPLNKEVFNKVANKCYIPTNRIMLDLIDKHDIKIAYSITGVFLEQAMEFNDEVLDLFKDLVKTGNVELIGETYHHSLSSLFETHDEFKEDILRHKKLIKDLFNYKTEVFRNTELIYHNSIAKTVKDIGGFKGIFTEGADRLLDWRSPNYVYDSLCGLNVLLRNYQLSDDVGFRFSCCGWEDYPLYADKYAKWLANTPGDCINIYVDYETFGEHQWKETGIFEFLKELPNEIEKYSHLEYAKPTEILDKCRPKGEIDVFEFSALSWADTERDISAWLGNRLQKTSFDKLKSIREPLGRYIQTNNKNSKNNNSNTTDTATLDNDLYDEIMEYRIYKNLQTSDNFYYQCTKGFNDMDVHAYFSHFETPYDAFVAYMDIVYDFKTHLTISQILEIYKEKLNRLNNELNELKELNKKENEDTSELNNIINDLKDKIKNMELQLNLKDENIQKLKEEGVNLVNKLKQYEKEIISKTENVKKEIMNLKKEHEQEIKKKENKLGNNSYNIRNNDIQKDNNKNNKNNKNNSNNKNNKNSDFIIGS